MWELHVEELWLLEFDRVWYSKGSPIDRSAANEPERPTGARHF